MTNTEMIASHTAHRIFSECVPPLHDKRFKMEVCEKIILEAIKQATGNEYKLGYREGVASAVLSVREGV